MGLDSTSQIAQVINNIVNEQETIKESYADEGNINFLLSPFERVIATGVINIYRKPYPTTSFILDHPVYGELDSSILELDGGYAAGSTLMESILI